MVDIEGPRLARPDEFPPMMELVDRCFHCERGGMAARLPFVYDEKYPEHHAVILRDGRIVAHAAAIPQMLAVGDGTVDCRGIGGVATDRRYRGEGYMGDLIRFWLDQVDVPLLELGGDRQRYGHFGWENGGREFRYRVTERSLPGTTPSVSVQRYNDHSDVLDTLHEIHEEDPYRVDRDHETSAQVFGSRGSETLFAGGDESGYLIFDREDSDAYVTEFGGTARGVKGLLGTVFDRFDVDALTVLTPPRHRLNSVLKQVSASWKCTVLRKLNVRDLPSLLNGFESQMARRWTRRETGRGELTFGIDGDPDAVRLRYGDKFAVERTTDDPEISFDRREMTQFLFGCPDQMFNQREAHPVLDIVFPLKYYIWTSERV